MKPFSLHPFPRLIFFPSARFKDSKFDNKEDLAAFTTAFDTGLKTSFSDNSKPQFVKFGSLRDNDTRCGVKSGKLSLAGWVAPSHVLEVQCDILSPGTRWISSLNLPSMSLSRVSKTQRRPTVRKPYGFLGSLL